MRKKILLLHGAIGSKYQFMALKKELLNTFDVFTMNFSGHGGNDPKEVNFTIDGFTNDVISFLDQEKIDQINIFGYSMGGYVALNVAINFPERIDRIYTLATKYTWNKESAEKMTRLMDPDKLEEKVPEFAQVLKKRHSPVHWENVMHKTSQLMTELGSGAALTKENLETVKNEITVTVGKNDNVVTIEESKALTGALPNAVLKVYENTGHGFEEMNLEELTKDLTVFFL